jgi:hypothetical protein
LRFAVITPSSQSYVHARAFDEVAEAVNAGLVELGHDSARVVGALPRDRVNIIFGAHLLEDIEPHPGSILFNLEQVVPGAVWLNSRYIDVMKRFPVWDYSAENVDALRKRGIPDVTYVPVGYARCLERITPREEDVDVLFYGSINDRRRLVLDRLNSRGVKVEVLIGVYGEQRDEFIARSKIVLNMHFYENRPRLEIARCFYLLANGRFVVSEESFDVASSGLAEGMVVAKYGELAERCIFYLSAPHQRARIAGRGKEIMKSRPQADALRQALSSTDSAFTP